MGLKAAIGVFEDYKTRETPSAVENPDDDLSQIVNQKCST
jgi:hypothetical protein